MTNGFEHVARLTRESAQARAIAGMLSIVQRAWLHSGLRSLLHQMARQAGGMSIAERWRMTAIVVAVAAFTNALARAFIPLYAAPGLPVTVILVIAIVSVAIAAAPHAFVSAWRSSRFRRSHQR